MSPREKDGLNTEISLRNTKQEILEAYETALRHLEEKQPLLPQEEQKKDQERAVVEKASENSVESVIRDLSQMKLSVVKTLDSLSENLVSECNKLADIQKAISIEQKHIQDLYSIKETANTLSALLRSQEERKNEFEILMQERKTTLEKEIESTKNSWTQKQEILESEYNQRKELLEKERKREEEDFNYNLASLRRKEQDAYESKKVALEKELNDKIRRAEADFSEREATIVSQEKELLELRSKVATFPEQMNQIREETKESVTKELEIQYRFTSEIKAKEVEGEMRLNTQKIASLEAKIKEQEAFIEQLTQRSDEARSQVQEIARRALETSSQRYFMPSIEKTAAVTG